MDKLLAPTKEDLKTLQKREFRQRQEQIRKERIFNPRVRLIGIDKIALDQHVQAKEHEKQMEQKEKLCFAFEQDRQARVVQAELGELAEEQMRAQREMNAYRTNFQRKDQGRDFDLNDPEYLRKMPPHGLDWLGEDPNSLHRMKLQRQQQKSWLMQQMDEKDRTRKDLTDAEQAQQMSALCKDAELKKSAEYERQRRQLSQMDTAMYNLALARAQKAKRMENRRREEQDNLAEIMNNLSSDMLLENKEAGASSSLLGGRRITAAMYRGMTDDQLVDIRKEQLKQIRDKNEDSARVKDNEKMFDEIVKNRINLLENEEHEMRRQRQEMLREQHSTNARLLREQKQRNCYLNDEVYKFKPTDEYFQQFNTTTR